MKQKLSEREAEKMREFCIYFNELEDLGIPYGQSELYEKAKELGLKPPEDN